MAADPPRVELRVVPAVPRAGEWFLLVVNLVDGPPSAPLTITFEKHRIFVDSSGKHAICPIEEHYFDDGSLSPVSIAAPDTSGVSRARVLPNAQNPPCPPPPPPPDPAGARGIGSGDGPDNQVKFPDWLHFTAFVKDGTTPVAQGAAAATIQPPTAQL